MNAKIVVVLFAVASLYAARQSSADQEAGNSLYVTANGDWYAKSIPDASYGTTGKTLVYLAQPKVDKLQYSYDWYSPGKLFLMQGAEGVSVVRFGPWHRGNVASKSDFELAFYNGNKCLAEYSALDIAGSQTNVSRSVSHYEVIKKVIGYRQLDSDDWVFEIERVDGKILTFDIKTGKLK